MLPLCHDTTLGEKTSSLTIRVHRYCSFDGVTDKNDITGRLPSDTTPGRHQSGRHGQHCHQIYTRYVFTMSLKLSFLRIFILFNTK